MSAKQDPGTASNGRREATKERNRDLILSAGRDVFATVGYGGATVRDLIRASGLATGTFYNYFPDKESVFMALVESSATELRAKLATSRADATSPETFVSDGFLVFFTYLANDPTFLGLVGRNAGDVRALLDEPALGGAVEELDRDLRDAVARGDIPKLDADLMAAAMSGAALELGLRMLERDDCTPQQAARFATDLFLGGIERLGNP